MSSEASHQLVDQVIAGSDSIDPLIDHAPCGFLSFTDDGTIVLMNATLLELLGYKLGDKKPEKIEVILPIASRIFYQTHFFPLLKLRMNVSEIYFSLRSKQGVDIPMLINGIRRQHGEQFLNDCIFIPITQRIQYEDEILTAKKAAEAAILEQQRLASELQQELQIRKRAEGIIREQAEREYLLRKLTQKLHQSLDLSQIFEVAVSAIRQSLQADRVGIFEFYPDAKFTAGQFVVESLGEGIDSSLETVVYEHNFSNALIRAYCDGRVHAIADRDSADLQECYRNLLAQFQIRANLVIPLLRSNELWGFLCIHQCVSPRSWQDVEIKFAQKVAHQIEVAIQQADLFSRLQKELQEKEQAERHLTAANRELENATQLLEKLVNTDGLTQIANRRCFNHQLEQEWLRLYREQQSLSILLFDVDYFKRYNDTYGHQLGDECLIKIAHAVEQAIRRPADLVARYGGEEFIVMLPNTESEGAMVIAERIHRAIAAIAIPHRASEVSDRVTISLGIASTVPDSGMDVSDLIRCSDQALYRAKEQGRNRSAEFSS